MPESKPPLKLADKTAAGKPTSSETASTPEETTREILREGKPKFEEHDVCQYNGALVVVIGRALELVGVHLHWRYLVNLGDGKGRCPYMLSAGSWAPEANLKSMDECAEDLKDSVSRLES